MSRLNIFEYFENKEKWHEDQLTRMFLVVLRCSPSSLLIFYDYVCSSVNKLLAQKGSQTILPSISEIDLDKVVIETQLESITGMLSKQIISVLITDKHLETKKDVMISERGARYDGVLSLSGRVTLIIENKPSFYNVQEEQLNPSRLSLGLNIDKEVELIVEKAAVLEWKEIIIKLHKLIQLGSISGAEKMIIEDFMEVINKYFPFLNPYDNFSLCRNYRPHLLERTRKILQSLAIDDEAVKYHRGWGMYIETGFEEISRVGLIIREGGNMLNIEGRHEWDLDLELWFGDTMNQARHFYKKGIEYKKLDALINIGWRSAPNFHISHIQQNLIWVSTPSANKKSYYDYWLSNIDKVRQYSKDDLLNFLNELDMSGIIDIDEGIKTKIEQEIIHTKKNYFNICPGFGLVYVYDPAKAIELDQEGKLIPEIKNKVVEGLGILDKNIDFLRL